ncbi:TetR/AcrR family transcriptional regulator [Dactylosporangium sp. NPDC000521]|uniref:TetR/AcrR family transcriptional regulator n=1 Tax=Dactylosporangium sp. NPDC000521 TaxID=3363975 RepID=UPI00369BBCCF
MTAIPVRDRLVDAALALFDERGYEQTTADDIADRAGVGRTTLFRHYRSKEDVIFPDHDRLLATVKERLATSTADTAIVAVTEAVRLVLLRYIEEGDRARLRYALTSRISTLRDREIASVARYQRLFREFIAESWGPAPGAALRAELMAAAVVSAHNHVLRRWLRRDTAEPVAELDAAMAQVVSLFTDTGAGTEAGGAADGSTNKGKNTSSGGGTAVIVVHDQRDPEHVAAAIRRALQQV